MKNAILISAFALITLASFAKEKETVQVLVARMNTLYLKVEKDFAGSVIEIYNEAGELIATEAITERKILIDFDTVCNGVYTIKVKKNSEETVLDYHHAEGSMTLSDQKSCDILIVQGI
jgi:hypothetical protein